MRQKARTRSSTFTGEYGRRIHHDEEFDFDLVEALESIGLDASHAATYDSETFDTEIAQRHDAGLALCGEDVGTPIIGLRQPTR